MNIQEIKYGYLVFMRNNLAIKIEKFTQAQGRKRIISSLLIVLLIFANLSPSSAAKAEGKKCPAKKVDLIYKAGSSYLLCEQIGTKYKWTLSNKKDYQILKAKLLEDLAKINAEYEARKENQAAADAQAEADAQAAAAAQNAKNRIDSLTQGLSYQCVVGKYCSIGNTGPGGGIVFYGKGLVGSENFFEVGADNGSEFSLPYCFPRPGIKTLKGYEFNGINDYIMQYPDKPGYSYIDTRIGDGSHNTNLIAEKCQSSAANKVLEYRGGGKSDWFLPSAAELKLVWISRNLLKDIVGEYYWSSSEYNLTKAKGIKFDNSANLANLTKGATYRFRPIRKF